MNKLFDRLSLQGRLQAIIDQYGQQEGWRIIEEAVSRQIRFLDDPGRVKYLFKESREASTSTDPVPR